MSEYAYCLLLCLIKTKSRAIGSSLYIRKWEPQWYGRKTASNGMFPQTSLGAYFHTLRPKFASSCSRSTQLSWLVSTYQESHTHLFHSKMSPCPLFSPSVFFFHSIPVVVCLRKWLAFLWRNIWVKQRICSSGDTFFSYKRKKQDLMDTDLVDL